MKLSLKYDINMACRVLLQEHLDRLELPYVITGIGEFELTNKVSSDLLNTLQSNLKRYGIEIIDNPKNILVEKIKDVIREMVHAEDKVTNLKTSAYIADKMNHSYGYLSNVFSEVTFSTIENFIILQKIELAKQLLLEGKLTLTEIAWQLNYSSVAHLSNQFKKTTGLSPTAFQRIIKRRKENPAFSSEIANPVS